MMADESDDCRDVVACWNLQNEGWDAVFGSRFLKGGGVIDYPWLKLFVDYGAHYLAKPEGGGVEAQNQGDGQT